MKRRGISRLWTPKCFSGDLWLCFKKSYENNKVNERSILWLTPVWPAPLALDAHRLLGAHRWRTDGADGAAGRHGAADAGLRPRDLQSIYSSSHIHCPTASNTTAPHFSHKMTFSLLVDQFVEELQLNMCSDLTDADAIDQLDQLDLEMGA